MLDFEKMPRFKAKAADIFRMIPQWAFALGVSEAAVERQIPIAHAWADSNPKKAPKANMTRFLDNWMKKAQKFGNLVETNTRPTYQEHKPVEDEVMTGEDFARMREAIRNGDH